MHSRMSLIHTRSYKKDWLYRCIPLITALIQPDPRVSRRAIDLNIDNACTLSLALARSRRRSESWLKYLVHIVVRVLRIYCETWDEGGMVGYLDVGTQHVEVDSLTCCVGRDARRLAYSYCSVKDWGKSGEGLESVRSDRFYPCSHSTDAIWTMSCSIC